MIEINLVPDVKLELLRARKLRNNVISACIVITIAAVGIVVLLGLYNYGALAIADASADRSINEQSAKLKKVPDLAKTLTLQQQLASLTEMHNNKLISSRLFDIATTIIPDSPNDVTISRLTLDTESTMITIEGQAKNGYEALEVFKKTIEETKFDYGLAGIRQEPINIALEVTDGDRSYGEDSNGEKTLRFTMQFTYPLELFARTSQQGKIVAPNKYNATDSVLGVPKSLFSTANPTGGEN